MSRKDSDGYLASERAAPEILAPLIFEDVGGRMGINRLLNCDFTGALAIFGEQKYRIIYGTFSVSFKLNIFL